MHRGLTTASGADMFSGAPPGGVRAALARQHRRRWLTPARGISLLRLAPRSFPSSCPPALLHIIARRGPKQEDKTSNPQQRSRPARRRVLLKHPAQRRRAYPTSSRQGHRQRSVRGLRWRQILNAANLHEKKIIKKYAFCGPTVAPRLQMGNSLFWQIDVDWRWRPAFSD